MRIKGRTTHCDTELRAGQRKAARGNDGRVVVVRVVEDWTDETSLPLSLFGFLILRRGLRGEGATIVTVGSNSERPQYALLVEV
jgi:hypothetical protein